MTTTNGTYMFCDADLSFSMTFTCAGPSCTSLLTHNNLTCTQTSSQSWNCTNGVTCSSAAGFTSKFSIGQSNTDMSQTQDVSLNGTSFVFQQDAEGNVKLSNGTSTTTSTASSKATATGTATTTSTATGTAIGTATTSTMSAAASASPTTSKSGSTRQSFPTLILCAMLLLSLFTTTIQAQVTGVSIGNAVNAIFQGLDKTGNGSLLFDIGASGMAKAFNTIAIKTCSSFVGQGPGSLSRLPLAYGQCEEAMFSAEMSLVGSSLNFTSYNNYTGLGGAQATALTSVDDTTVQNTDGGAIPELFLANSALCGLLVAAIQQTVLNPSSENLCSALESAIVLREPPSTSTTAAMSSTAPCPTSTSTSTSTTTSSPASTTAATGTNGTLPADISTNKCLSCFLNIYLDSLVELSAETCNNIPAKSGSAYDLSGYFCDPSIVSSSASSSAFCSSLCAKPCATFLVTEIISALGSSYVANPAVNVNAQGALCNTCGSQGAQGQDPEKFMCAMPSPNCLCGIGSQLCRTGCD